ncbi:putative Ulp1 protease family catalytic domain, papain-like cysteine peptidase superfamily [Helianthus annuus]|uniref:Ulp1 protease family catalytic domain, papain-like cysteine peptidase superfamily n=1 Tax=Helianthus annuus TaxID=4232 RepID=A0A9K3IPE5_HELAN|nr:putative Ulp1 protease family catalytic domain, papain-like cysteine peptidase superfamily [Helianthus annuus]KAJ0788180.1 putative Ulp1 protease family catalytic domain, papain-like cysteine peptidase superfamily [Helianthus annuus]
MVVSQFDSTPFRITSSMWPEVIKEIEKAEQVASSKKDGADHGVGGEEEKDAGGEKAKDGKPDGETTKKGGEDANEPPKGESDTAGQPAKKEGNEAAGQPARQGEVFKTPEKEPKKDSEKQEFIGEDLNAGVQKKSKRTTHPAEPLCSPYMQRVVQIKTKTEKIEVRIAEWMFSTVDDPWVFIFETAFNTNLSRVCLESLHPNLYIHVQVLTAWSLVLNSEEVYRSKGSPARVFCPCNMLGENNFKPKLKKETCAQNFSENIAATLMTTEFGTIRKVDMLFIPILQHKHYYIVCFDFKGEAIKIIDNMKGKAKAQKMARAKRVKEIVCDYLEVEYPTMHKKMSPLEPEIMNMSWQTEKNFVDCGVFAMRHMETYTGNHVSKKEWDSGLSKESPEQDKELVELRYKYLSKILLSDINLAKGEMMELLEKYEKMEPEKKEECKKNAETKINDRLNQKY